MINKKIKSFPKPTWFLRLGQVFQHGDRPWRVLIVTVSILVILLMVAIGGMLWKESSGARQAFGWGFLFPTVNASWDPVKDHFQAWPFIPFRDTYPAARGVIVLGYESSYPEKS